MSDRESLLRATQRALHGTKVKHPTPHFYAFIRSIGDPDAGSIYTKFAINRKDSGALSTGIRARKEDFNTQTLEIKGNPDGTARLLQFKADVMRVFTERCITGRSLDPRIIRDIALGLRGHDSDPLTVIMGIRHYVAQKEQLLGNGLTNSSIELYRRYGRILEAFITLTYGKNMPFDELKPSLEHDLMLYLKGKKRYVHNYALKVFQFMKTILEYAVSYEWATRNVLRSARIRKSHKPVITLTIDDINKLKAMSFVEPNATLVRDIFLWSIYSGMAYADIAALRPHHIVTVNGVKCILKDRQKSGVQAFVPLFPDAQALLDTYADNDLCRLKGLLLPVLSNQQTNKWLKVVGNLAGITQTLHMHLGRKTFTTYTEELGFSLNDMATMLGHKNVSMTESRYYQRRQEPVIAKFKEIFINPNADRKAS